MTEIFYTTVSYFVLLLLSRIQISLLSSPPHSSTLKLTLGVVNARPGGEVDDVVDELLCVETLDEASGDEGLATAGGSDQGEGQFVVDDEIEEIFL